MPIGGSFVNFISPPIAPGQTALSVLERIGEIHGCILVYDVTDGQSVSGLYNWWKDANRGDVPSILIGTHADCEPSHRKIPSGAVRIVALSVR